MKKIDFKDKAVIVTGATSGIGRAITEILIERYNCTVYGVARSVKNNEELRKKYDAKYQPCTMDVTVEHSWDKMANFFENCDTPPHILINCAGILPEFSSVESTDIETYRRVMELNYFSCVYACRCIMPLLQKGGAVVNVSSASALCPFAGVSAYSASKAALERYTESLAREVKDISVSVVLPGFVKTNIMKNQNASDEERSLIDRFSADPHRTAEKLLKRVAKRKSRIVLGADGHFLGIMYRLFPNASPRIVSGFLKKSGLELFKKI